MTGDKRDTGDVSPFYVKLSLSEKTLEEREESPISLYLPFLVWRRVGPNTQMSDSGYRVQAVRVGDGWRFSAWGPDRAPGWSYRDFSNGRCAYWAGDAVRERYAVGEAIPQRCVLLGSAATAGGARALCEARARGVNQLDQVEAV